VIGCSWFLRFGLSSCPRALGNGSQKMPRALYKPAANDAKMSGFAYTQPDLRDIETIRNKPFFR
jgi:hypothetical protein